MKGKLLIFGMSYEKAIDKLNKISPHWGNKSKKNLEIESDADIETVYDILIEFATAFVENRLTEAQIEEVDTYYRDWYGYTIREED